MYKFDGLIAHSFWLNGIFRKQWNGQQNRLRDKTSSAMRLQNLHHGLAHAFFFFFWTIAKLIKMVKISVLFSPISQVQI